MLVGLDDVTAADRRVVGGKAVGLRGLHAAGLPTPPTVVLTTAAFRRFAAETAMPDAVAECLRTVDLDAGDGLAVRSSAVAEDAADRSCAGLFVTRLGVPADELEQAVLDCWRSARLPDGPPTGEEMAVVIQPLLPCTAAAVVFTVDPLGGALHVRVAATAGLGEPLVSGQVTGDVYVVDRVTLTVLDLQAEGEPVLTESAAGELVELALRAERAFGCPLDIEAGLTDGWSLVQARPITTVTPAAALLTQG
jgi:phosphoenolpyruvate synthase/pyruvate phosphate dikinase